VDLDIRPDSSTFEFRSVWEIFTFRADTENHAIFESLNIRLPRRSESRLAYNCGTSVVLEGHCEVFASGSAIVVDEDEKLAGINRFLWFLGRVFEAVVEMKGRVIVHFGSHRAEIGWRRLYPMAPWPIHQTTYQVAGRAAAAVSSHINDQSLRILEFSKEFDRALLKFRFVERRDLYVGQHTLMNPTALSGLWRLLFLLLASYPTM
jgi:hypothetical protein